MAKRAALFWGKPHNPIVLAIGLLLAACGGGMVVPEITPTPQPVTEPWLIQIEWPPYMVYGDSDVLRFTLTPTENGILAKTEFPDHETIEQELEIVRPGDARIDAIARLDATGFEISPASEQARTLAPGEPVTWRWSVTPRQAGRQRLAISLVLKQYPQASAPAGPGTERILAAYSISQEVSVYSFFGMSRATASMVGFFLFLAVALAAVWGATRWILARGTPQHSTLQVRGAVQTVVEPAPSLRLSEEEKALTGVMFQRHARLILEREYISGYSNARTFLAQPIHPDGRADAYTIIKISDKKQIEKEYKNYQAYVRESLPPVTGRILDRPVTRNTRLAGLRYTFVGEIGSTPRSLKEVFLANADPSVLDNLMKNFGPNWWLQRQPYTFRLGQEYDRKLPAHYTLKRARKTEQELDGNKPPWEQTFSPGQRLQLKNFPRENRHMGRDHWSLRGKAAAGFAPLRVNLPGEEDIPTTPAGEVTHTRVSLLRELTDSFDLGGLPDPIERIPELLAQKVSGTKSIIHGDLNLENVILGPGGLLWLIDFAETRFGHPIFDFVTLAADIIAHVIRTQVAKPSSYLRLYEQDEFPLLSKVRSLAQSCWFDRGNPREYQLALALTCLGAIKHTNLDGVSRHLLYLTAAYEAQNL